MRRLAIEPDPTRDELRRWWAALIDGETNRRSAVSWASDQLAAQSWRDEVTHQGLQLLNDRVSESWDFPDGETRARLFRVYWDWMEVVHWFEDDPIAWNRNYAFTFVSGLHGSELRRKALAGFVASGFLTDVDVIEWRFERGPAQP